MSKEDGWMSSEQWGVSSVLLIRSVVPTFALRMLLFCAYVVYFCRSWSSCQTCALCASNIQHMREIVALYLLSRTFFSPSGKSEQADLNLMKLEQWILLAAAPELAQSYRNHHLDLSVLFPHTSRSEYKRACACDCLALSMQRMTATLKMKAASDMVSWTVVTEPKSIIVIFRCSHGGNVSSGHHKLI